MLHAPDFLGYAGAIELARDHADIVKRGLALKKTGNALMTLIGGREIHPVNVRVGGFYKTPRKRDFAEIAEHLKRARDLAVETVRWVSGFDFPDRNRDYELVSLKHPDEYPINEGRVVSNRGLDITAREYDAHFEEIHVPHSNALQSRIRARGHYLVGPLARFALNFDKLPPICREAAHEAGIAPICTNPYQSIVVRAVEVLYACDEALRIIDAYQEPDRPFVAAEPRAAVGYAATEAPRGMLWHRYKLAADGAIEDAVIVPPTSQNQASVEDDLKILINGWIDLPDDELRHRCEQTVRNYDPCISCATHFLDLRIDRG
jgi:coenzyme F420-reducing hydrogenase alpha subunit